MIIKASQRGSGRELAAHLLNGHDNEMVEVHAIDGFSSNNLRDAFLEIEAISQGTKCRQYLFSISLSPPQEAEVSTQTFEDAISRIAKDMKLEGQPHAIVLHEKNARRHCHVVFSRIDADEMKAINLPYFKNRLMEISKDLYLEHGWSLPKGFIDREKSNPLNFTLQEWQQAKRLNEDPRLTKLTLKKCWETSDSKRAFEQALKQHGYYLAKGDRRGFVAVDWRGEVYSLSRWCGLKTKALKERLGDTDTLPTVDQTKQKLDQTLVQRMHNLRTQIDKHHEPQFSALRSGKQVLLDRHAQEREGLEMRQAKRQAEEHEARQNRFAKGLRGLWSRVTGHHAKTQQQNEIEAYQGILRDRAEKDELIFRQIEERQEWKKVYDALRQQHYEQLHAFSRAVFSKLPDHKVEMLKQDDAWFAQTPSEKLRMSNEDRNQHQENRAQSQERSEHAHRELDSHSVPGPEHER